MAQRSKSKQFTALARSGSKKSAVNSGILSNSGVRQKMDSLPKPSYGKKADPSVVKAATTVHGIKVGMKHTKAPKSAAAIAKYAK